MCMCIWQRHLHGSLLAPYPPIFASVCPFSGPALFAQFTVCRAYTHRLRDHGSDGVCSSEKGKGSPYSITERRVPELIPVLGSRPAGDVSHKLGGRLPLVSARPAITLATLKMASTSFAAW